MKALIYSAPKTIEIRQVDEPVPAVGQALLAIQYCGVCGTDVGIWAGTHPRAEAPLILGHEFIGVVEHDTTRFPAGSRVVAYPLFSCGTCHPCINGRSHICRQLRLIGIDGDGGMAERLAVNEELLVSVPDALDDRLASLIEPLAVGVRAVEQSGMVVCDRVLVVGAGPIGLITALVARHAGAGEVIVSDVHESRLALAARLGFTTVNAGDGNVSAQVLAQTGSDGVDVSFECAGVPSAMADAIAATRPAGTICLASLHKAHSPVPLLDVAFSELRIVGTRVYTREQFQRAVALASVLAAPLQQLITRCVPLADAGGVFDDMAARGANDIKILIDCRSAAAQ